MVTGISSDSREIEAGYLFVCISGAHVDGAAFAAQAVEKGAVAVLTTKHLDLPSSTVQIQVPDIHHALEDMVPFFYDYPGKKMRMIGVTGTNGKTSTTEMTSEMLTACGLTAPAVGNIGKAVSHAAVDPANDVLCVELSSFQLHFTYSLELDCAAITNIADDHLDWHGGIENYAADKAKVFHNVKKALVYNADDERVTKLAFAAQTVAGMPPDRLHVGRAEGRADRCETMAGSSTCPALPAEKRESRSKWRRSPISRI